MARRKGLANIIGTPHPFPDRVWPSRKSPPIPAASNQQPHLNASALPLTDVRPQLGQAPLRVVDSITELSPADAGSFAVSGSHGGASSARYAMAARPLLSVFNDAGVGKDAAGIAGLDLLQAQGLGACTVSNTSACIGQAASTLQDGVISHANAMALSLGAIPGTALKSLLDPQPRTPACTTHSHPNTLSVDT